ncbi:MAG: HEAT repeat domain-containing protein [Acidobacteria bacterium]|nr:HEAT repeat domain-containing protein [Acidobacteriota bacterium]
MSQNARSPKKNPKASSNGARLALVVLSVVAVGAAAQERGPAATSLADIRAAINRLADIDYSSRSKAARVVRRSAAAQAVPALLQAVNEHQDGFVRFKSLVLLTGFNDPRAADEMREALASPNDRLREVAYGFFERNPDPALTEQFLAALQKEQGDFVRPALVRALAALGDHPKVRDALLADVTRGVDHFRSSVIEALGDFKQAAAIVKLTDVVNLDGPLQDDAVLALGKIGDKRSLATFSALQRTGGRSIQPTVAAAICLLGVNCAAHLGYLQKMLGFADDNAGYQELVRAAAFGLDAVAIAGNAEALDILFGAGIPSSDPVRAPLALSVAKVALRNTPLMLQVLQQRKDQTGAIELLSEGFDMLEEDLEEEQFFVTVRRGYWAAANGSPLRRLSEQLITKLDF